MGLMPFLNSSLISVAESLIWQASSSVEDQENASSIVCPIAKLPFPRSMMIL